MIILPTTNKEFIDRIVMKKYLLSIDKNNVQIGLSILNQDHVSAYERMKVLDYIGFGIERPEHIYYVTNSGKNQNHFLFKFENGKVEFNGQV
jgi:uncharacterized protein YpmB